MSDSTHKSAAPGSTGIPSAPSADLLSLVVQVARKSIPAALYAVLIAWERASPESKDVIVWWAVDRFLLRPLAGREEQAFGLADLLVRTMDLPEAEAKRLVGDAASEFARTWEEARPKASP